MAVAQQAAVPAIDRRAAARRQPTLGTVCRLESHSGDEVGTALVWNISTTGISMLLHLKLDPGAAIRAQLMTEHEEFSLPVTLRVAHVARLRTGDYIMGCQFPQPLSGDEMKHFVA